MPDDDSSASSASSASSSSSSQGDDNPTSTKRPRTEQTPTSRTGPATAAPLEIAAPASSADSQRRSAVKSSRKIIVLLDQAKLETVKNRRGDYELINCDDHREICKRKLKIDPREFRPDICHQELLALIDSPLNKAGRLKVYVRTSKNVLFEVAPSVRIPRTYRRFSGLMVQLLHKLKIKAGKTSETLMNVIKNPFSQHLPAGTRVYGMSSQGTLYSPFALANEVLPEDDVSRGNSTPLPPICFIIGAMATGHVTLEDHPYIEHMISVSEYPLSGAAAISRILGGIEHRWGIV